MTTLGEARSAQSQQALGEYRSLVQGLASGTVTLEDQDVLDRALCLVRVLALADETLDQDVAALHERATLHKELADLESQLPEAEAESERRVKALHEARLSVKAADRRHHEAVMAKRNTPGPWTAIKRTKLRLGEIEGNTRLYPPSDNNGITATQGSA